MGGDGAGPDRMGGDGARPDRKGGGPDQSNIRGAEASHGPCFGTNEHPRRDTDVISRLSKSTIQDLSFYIGFTRIGLRIKDLGPWTLDLA